MTDATHTLRRYFDAFNAGDVDAMLAELSDDVAHHVNEGKVRRGKAAFAEFCAHMSHCYAEELTDIVLFSAQDGTRAAAEFTVNGTYLQTDPGLPDAHGQTYCLPGGSFMTLQDGKISRVTTYYNLADWLQQVS
ncbi:ketosteroid isomerase-related protein [Yoonia sp.]|uniref:ketosteroid isomerase-related protein n=1 Tax=Yoonia sp. TaxID=2212373 RepID=UPI001A07D421|nr:ketosteroid isomerase-related protein [Yoonia sp.]MBE0414752.1 nuclear transport factor 2 family protein [Yoonia sp.]